MAELYRALGAQGLCLCCGGSVQYGVSLWWAEQRRVAERPLVQRECGQSFSYMGSDHARLHGRTHLHL